MARAAALRFRSLTTKLVGGFLVVAAVTFAVGIFGLSKEAKIYRSVDQASTVDFPALSHLADARAAALTVRITVLQHVLSKDPAKIAGFDTQIQELDGKLADA